MNIDYSRYYSIWHSDSPGHVENMKNYYQKLLAIYIPDDKNIFILDVGCGMGFSLLALNEMGFKNVEGIDIDPKQVQSCLNKKLNVTLVKDSIEYISKKENTYNMILAFDVIEHIPHQFQLEFVTSIQKALKKNGILICTVPNANSTLASRWRYNDWTHHISFTEHSLDFLLYNSGFSKIQILPLETRTRPRVLTISLFRWGYLKGLFDWILFYSMRKFRILELYAELGEEGKKIPISLNLLGVAQKYDSN